MKDLAYFFGFAGASARVALDLFPSPRGDGVAAFIEFDMVNEGLDRFTR